MAKIKDFEIITSKTTDELSVLIKARLLEGWQPMLAGFHVEYLNQTAANYLIAMIKTAPEPKVKTAKKTSPKKKKNQAKKK